MLLVLPKVYPSLCLPVLLLFSLLSLVPCGSPCGGNLLNASGVISTPNFPGKFPLPARCKWTIENRDPSAVIVLYFTQLYVTSGFSVTDYTILIDPWSDPTVLFESNEKSALETQWISTPKPYIVIDFELHSHYGTHIRALDNLLDVYGFNITYEIASTKFPEISREDPSEVTVATSGENSEEEAGPVGVRAQLCSVVDCSFSGHCYANANFTSFECTCFDGFSGPNCGDGPLCEGGQNVCENGARCRHAGATHILCVCPEGFTGVRCEIPVTRPVGDCVVESDPSCSDTGWSKHLCPYVGHADVTPCSCDATQAVPVHYDKSRYEVRLALDVMDNNRTGLTLILNRTITKLFRGISKIEALEVLNVTSHKDVWFHFYGAKSEREKYHMTLLKLLNRSNIGPYPFLNKVLDFNQEPMIHNKEILSNQRNNRVREGKEFILSCVAEGSRFIEFRWYKDNALINVNNSMREMWTKTSGKDSQEQYTSTLAIQSAHNLDQGRFTCQVIDLGYQQCQSLDLEVASAPEVKILPLTATVEKGSNLTLKCMSPDEHNFGNTSEKFGYSWIKDGALFPSDPNTEIWEDLEPGGSVLRVINIQKSVTYSCLVTAPNVPPSTSSSRLNIIEPSRATPLCPTTTSYGLSWPATLNGETAFVESLAGRCTVSRACTLASTLNRVDPALWELEDFSACVPPTLYTIAMNFHSLRLGYQTTSINLTLHDTADYLARGPQRYPGQTESTVTLLSNILRFIQHTTRTSLESLVHISEYFYVIVNYLLHWDQPLPSFVHRQKVIELQAIIEVWSLLWCNQLSGDHKRLLFDSLMIDVRKLYNLTSQYISVQQPSVQFKNNPSSWSPNTSVSFESSTSVQPSKGVLNLVIIAYANLSQYLAPRYLNKDSDLLYEVASGVVSTSLGDNGIKMAASSGDKMAAKKQHSVRKLRVQVQFMRPKNGSIPEGWNLTCGLSVNGGESWQLSCDTHRELTTVTCTCTQTGLHALLITLDKNQISLIVTQDSHLRVLVGYSSCVLEVAFTLLHILPRWFRRRSWFLFLKVKFCLMILLLMLLMTYLACQNSLSKTKLTAFLLLIQYLVLIALSCHLSGVLIIYSQVMLHQGHLKDPRLSILLTLHALSLLIVLSLSLASYHTRLVFYLCLASSLVYVLGFACLYAYVRAYLRVLTHSVRDKYVLTALNLRQRILDKSGLLVLSLSLCYACGILHLSLPVSLAFQYLMAAASFGLGLTIVLVYYVHTEPRDRDKPSAERSTSTPELVDSDLCEAFDLVLGAPQGRGNGMGGILKERREEEGEGIPLTESSGSGTNTGKMVTFSHDLIKDSELPEASSPSLSPSSGCGGLDILPPCIQQGPFGQEGPTTDISIEHQPLNSAGLRHLENGPLCYNSDNGPQRLLCSAVVETDMGDDSSIRPPEYAIVPNQSKMISFNTSVPLSIPGVPSVLNSVRTAHFSPSVCKVSLSPYNGQPSYGNDQNPTDSNVIPSQIPYDYPVRMSTILDSARCRTPSSNSHVEIDTSHRKTLDLSSKPPTGYSSFKVNSLTRPNSQRKQIDKSSSQFNSQTLGRKDTLGSRSNSQELSGVNRALDFRENSNPESPRLKSSLESSNRNTSVVNSSCSADKCLGPFDNSSDCDRNISQPNISQSKCSPKLDISSDNNNLRQPNNSHSPSYRNNQPKYSITSQPINYIPSHNSQLNNSSNNSIENQPNSHSTHCQPNSLTSRQFNENRPHYSQSIMCHPNSNQSNYIPNQSNCRDYIDSQSNGRNSNTQSCDDLANSIVVSSEALTQIAHNASISNLIVDGLRVDEINRPDPNSHELIESFAESTCTDSSDSAIADVDSNPNLSGADSSENSGNARASSDDFRSNPEGVGSISVVKTGYLGRKSADSNGSNSKTHLNPVNGNSEISSAHLASHKTNTRDSNMSLINPKTNLEDPSISLDTNSEGELLSQISQDLDYLLNGPPEDFSSLKRRKKDSPSRVLSSPSRILAVRHTTRNLASGERGERIDSENVSDGRL